MKLTFLRASNRRAFAKTITKTGTEFEVEPYPNVREMCSETVEVSSLTEFKDTLARYAAEGYCLLKGNTKKQLIDESRQGSHDPIAPTTWLCIDLDKIQGISHPRDVLPLLGPEFINVSFVYQPSASASYAPNNSFSGHLFIQLERPAHPGHIKNWLINANLTQVILSQQLVLTADGRSLRYKLDITTCQNDKLIFIAPPVCRGFEPLINLDPNDYFQVVQGTHSTVSIDFSRFATATVAEAQKARINELRRLAGLSASQTRTKTLYNKEVIVNPERAIVTGVKDQGAFVRLNIDGGDSWAYWHPKSNWEVIYSFKDETAFSAKDFVPDYYHDCQERAAEQHEVYHPEEGENGLRFIAFLDKATDTYYRGTWNPLSLELDLYATGARDKVENFYTLNNLPMPDALPEWQYEFRFDNAQIVDFDQGFLNRYVPPKVIIDAAISEDQPPTAIPSTISRIMLHAMGGDTDSYWHFVNWLAAIVQLRVVPRTAWIWQGTTGTGKGLLFHYVLTPLIGERYVGQKRLPDLLNRFNRFNRDHVLVLVDEADMDELNREAAQINSSLKNLITEPRIEWEEKGKQRRHVENYCSYIFTSNQPTPLHIEFNDRRFNVAPRQETQLSIIPGVTELLSAELPAFAAYLMNYNVDVEKARTPMVNQAHETLKRSGLTSLHEIAYAFKEGDFSYFLEQIPPSHPRDLIQRGQLKDYLDVMQHIVRDNAEDGARISRDQAEQLFIYLDDKTPHKNKFTTMLKRQGLPNQVLAGSYRGYRVKFAISEAQLQAFDAKLARLREEPSTQHLQAVK